MPFIPTPGSLIEKGIDKGVEKLQDKVSLPEQSNFDRERAAMTFGGKLKQTIHDKVGTPKNIGKTLLSLTGIKTLKDIL